MLGFVNLCVYKFRSIYSAQRNVGLFANLPLADEAGDVVETACRGRVSQVAALPMARES